MTLILSVVGDHLSVITGDVTVPPYTSSVLGNVRAVLTTTGCGGVVTTAAGAVATDMNALLTQVKNEPEDLTGSSRRDSTNNDPVNAIVTTDELSRYLELYATHSWAMVGRSDGGCYFYSLKLLNLMCLNLSKKMRQ